jgi:hypothetical protein
VFFGLVKILKTVICVLCKLRTVEVFVLWESIKMFKIVQADRTIQLFPLDDERLSLETCRGGKINTLKKVKKVHQVG